MEYFQCFFLYPYDILILKNNNYLIIFFLQKKIDLQKKCILGY